MIINLFVDLLTLEIYSSKCDIIDRNMTEKLAFFPVLFFSKIIKIQKSTRELKICFHN